MQPLVIFNSYGPNYKIRKPAFVLGDFVLAEFISTKESANRTDILAIYSRLDSGLLTHTGAKLVKLKGGIVKGANPYNIDLFAMVFSNVDYRPNIVYQDTAPTPDSNGRLINTLFSATYHDTITLLTYSSRFPVQDVTIAF